MTKTICDSCPILNTGNDFQKDKCNLGFKTEYAKQENGYWKTTSNDCELMAITTKNRVILPEAGDKK